MGGLMSRPLVSLFWVASTSRCSPLRLVLKSRGGPKTTPANVNEFRSSANWIQAGHEANTSRATTTIVTERVQKAKFVRERVEELLAVLAPLLDGLLWGHVPNPA